MRDLTLPPTHKAEEAEQLPPEQLEALYAWIDDVPLSRPKKNFARDFSDGVLVAEVCRHFLPKLVDLNNYVPAHSVAQKEANWQTLATKVLRKLGMKLTKGEIEAVASSKPSMR